LDWLAESDATDTAYHYVDTGRSGLIIRAGAESAIQVLGTDSTGAENDVLMYGNATVGEDLSVGQSLAVAGVDVLSELAAKQPTLSGSSVVTESRLTATNEVVSDSIRASTANAVTCTGNMVVQGSLTVGGLNVANALAASEPAFTAVAPLEKGVNLQTGELELRLDTAGLGNPFWCAGVVDGRDLSILASQGQVAFTVARPPQFGVGVYKITFAASHPAGDK
jgi:hypothetical protein